MASATLTTESHARIVCNLYPIYHWTDLLFGYIDLVKLVTAISELRFLLFTYRSWQYTVLCIFNDSVKSVSDQWRQKHLLVGMTRAASSCSLLTWTSALLCSDRSEYRTSLPKVIWEESRVATLSKQDKTTRGHGRRHYSAAKSASPMFALQSNLTVAHVRRKVPIDYNGAPQIRPQKYPSVDRSPNLTACLIPGPVRPTMPNGIRILFAVLPQCTGHWTADRRTYGKVWSLAYKPLLSESDAA